MGLQYRLTNVPRMFSEGIEEAEAGRSQRPGAGRLLAAGIGGVSAMVAASLGARTARKTARLTV